MPESKTDTEKDSETRAQLRCFDCYPIHGCKYFLLLGCTGGEISYYSKGVSWSDDDEIRVARLVNTADTVQYYKGKNTPLAIINTSEDFYIWMHHWCCHALIEKSIWQAIQFAR